MADNIGRIGFGIGGYVYGQQRREETPKENNAEQTIVNREETPVDPSKVMDFLANNNVFITPKVDKVSLPALDKATEDRIAASMANFEAFFKVAEEEVGKDLALVVTNEWMNKNL